MDVYVLAAEPPEHVWIRSQHPNADGTSPIVRATDAPDEWEQILRETLVFVPWFLTFGFEGGDRHQHVRAEVNFVGE